MTRPAIYLRVSTSEQAIEGLSLAHQEERGRAYIAAHGWGEPAIYLEPGVSAKYEDVAKRPAFARLLADIAAGAVDTVVIADLKRWSRRLKVTIATLEELARHECRLISLKESLDYTSAVGKLTVHVLGSIAQLESDERSETATAIHAYLRAQGKWDGGEPPYGAMLDDEGRLMLSPARSPLLRRVLALSATQSYHGVARQLTTEGVPPPGAGRAYRAGSGLEGRVWWPQTVRGIVQGGAWLASQPEPWPALWRAARDRERVPTSPVGDRPVRMLSGLMRCPSGGRVEYAGRDSYYLNRGKPRERQGTRCRAERRRPGGSGCPYGHTYADVYEAQVVARVAALAARPMPADRPAPAPADAADWDRLAEERRLLARASRVPGAYSDAELAAEVAALDARATALARRGGGPTPALAAVLRLLGAFATLPPAAQNAALRLVAQRVEVCRDAARVVWRPEIVALYGMGDGE
jgi:DNA invertase Pin-like site-specific DNA recombinase